MTSYDFTKPPASLEEFWMPFTPQRLFKKDPRMVVRAEGMYYYDEDGKEILDGLAGLWCVNAGHNNPVIADAVKAQLDTLDFMSNFQYGSPTVFEAARRLVEKMPEPFSHVFFSNSGSEAVDTAIKIAHAYWEKQGDHNRRIIISRERAYHGMNYGGTSAGGIPPYRKNIGPLLPDMVYLPHTHDPEQNAFKRGQPEYGGHFADELEDLIKTHGDENIAAVLIEPIAGATGVLPPPQGYLKRIREICDKYGLLLIFDEVITGFGRLGSISSTTYFDVMPDIITMAKGLSNAVIPIGATFVTDQIYDTFMVGPEHNVEFLHGYTYSGHPIAAAAVIGTLDAIEQDKIWENAQKMFQPFEDALHSLKDKPFVVDIRNCGILGCVQIEPHSEDDPGKYAREGSWELFRRGLIMRYSGPNFYFCPPLILNENHIDQMVTMLGDWLDEMGGRKASAA